MKVGIIPPHRERNSEAFHCELISHYESVLYFQSGSSAGHFKAAPNYERCVTVTSDGLGAR